MLSVSYAVSVMPRVSYAECHLCRVSVILKVFMSSVIMLIVMAPVKGLSLQKMNILLHFLLVIPGSNLKNVFQVALEFNKLECSSMESIFVPPANIGLGFKWLPVTNVLQ
jgi:hypothetical protein